MRNMLRTITTGRSRKRLLVPIATLFTVAGLVLTSSPAHAANYTATAERYASSSDDGGIDTQAWLDKQGVTSFQHYWIEFIAYSEVLWYDVDPRMNSRGVINVRVYNGSGRLVDTDRFTIDIGDVGSFHLGTPDGTGDIPEGYDVHTRICVGLSTTCTPYVVGNA